ncbi:serine protease [Desulfonema ishimotonii]|uniref:serine protease n=1 Tax=Desulfonema ishimotonii TaxID=45657 RepID=UPI001E49215C|nr:serine protease [Desulfonema ishimotonii]
MRLSECYIPLKKGIVAFVPKYLPANSDAPRAFPPIIGTGFVVDKNGLIVTNRHVIRAFGEISRPRMPRRTTGAFRPCCFTRSRAGWPISACRSSALPGSPEHPGQTPACRRVRIWGLSM